MRSPCSSASRPLTGVDETPRETETFTTTANLRERLQAISGQGIDAVFHAAAVSDFSFGKTWVRSTSGELIEVKSGKLSTREGTILAELRPTPKIITELRGWFPKACLVGWKYEVDGDTAEVIRLARRQINECQTDGCVANGPGYGPGYGLVRSSGAVAHAEGLPTLFELLEAMLR